LTLSTWEKKEGKNIDSSQLGWRARKKEVRIVALSGLIVVKRKKKKERKTFSRSRIHGAEARGQSVGEKKKKKKRTRSVRPAFAIAQKKGATTRAGRLAATLGNSEGGGGGGEGREKKSVTAALEAALPEIRTTKEERGKAGIESLIIPVTVDSPGRGTRDEKKGRKKKRSFPFTLLVIEAPFRPTRKEERKEKETAIVGPKAGLDDAERERKKRLKREKRASRDRPGDATGQMRKKKKKKKKKRKHSCTPCSRPDFSSG